MVSIVLQRRAIKAILVFHGIGFESEGRAVHALIFYT